MDFFAGQEVARRKSKFLVIYFVLAVIATVAAVYFAVMIAWYVTLYNSDAQIETFAEEFSLAFSWWKPKVFQTVVTITVLIVGLGSIYKIRQLSRGGVTIAHLLGGRLVATDSRELNEKKLLNVVEEMAIASGMPVPQVYLLEEQSSINAFAAGRNIYDAVIGVSRGAVEALTRDELQGVIAHEFSHILNGDMKLNVHLMGFLHGILIIGLIGSRLLESSFYSSRYSSRRSNRDGPGLPILVFGVAITAIGFIGVFFGKVIKSAVSRQREFLADASAVQFTRNSQGIAGALAKIFKGTRGAVINSSEAEEMSHFFFADGLKRSFTAFLATHPPLGERIKRVDKEVYARIVQGTQELTDDSSSIEVVDGISQFSSPGKQIKTSSSEIIDRVGNPNSNHLEYASRLLQTIPVDIRNKAHEVFSSQSVVYALLLDENKSVRERQIEKLHQNESALVVKEAINLAPRLKALGVEFRLPLIDLMLPTLKNLSKPQYDSFKQNLLLLIKEDNEITIFEYVLVSIVKNSLDTFFLKETKTPVIYNNLNDIKSYLIIVLSGIAKYGHETKELQQKAFLRGVEEIALGVNKDSFLGEVGLEEMDSSIQILRETTPNIKRDIITACIASVIYDGVVSVEEAELLRALCEFLDSPLPPFI